MCGESEEKGFQDEKRAELKIETASSYKEQKLDEAIREIIVEGFKKEEIAISKN